MGKLHIVHQLDTMDCGPACLKMVAAFHGRNYPMDYLRGLMCITREGVSLKGICTAAEEIGLKPTACKATFAELAEAAPFPCIVHWNQNHFVVVHKIAKGKVYVADPGPGMIAYTEEDFCRHWISCDDNKGIAVLFEPAPDFYLKPEVQTRRFSTTGFLSRYASQYKAAFAKLLAGLFMVSGIQLIFPFLTQAIVDRGIGNRDMHIIWLILLAEVSLLFGSTVIDFIRRRILLRISTKMNITLISDFFAKLMKLPMRFFYSKQAGDLLQRIEDHTRIENFLTSQSPNLIFAVFSTVTLCTVLGLYSMRILGIFILGSVLYVLWITLFLKKRKVLDYRYFEQQADQKDMVYEMVNGMTEIKLQGCEERKRAQWRLIQDRIFGINLRALSLSQTEEAGGICINELTNIVIIILSATAVIEGNLTLGMMLAIQSVTGQLRGPLDDIMDFAYQWQDVTISMNRINEIHTIDNEDTPARHITSVPDMSLRLDHVSFKYDRLKKENILNNICLDIPQGKVTAIVGTSGSGKTTLVKLLLGHFAPLGGTITVGGIDLETIDLTWWRRQCGAVMQDGALFQESIARNIALGYDEPDYNRLAYAARMANILGYIESLPSGFETILYQGGQNLSNGQRQRLLIARAIYRNPRLFVFDEATNSLDANNEQTIVENLREVFRDKTVVLIAHRLSTVKDADNIVVLDSGNIAEQGTHNRLVNQRGMYYRLVKNQLDIDN